MVFLGTYSYGLYVYHHFISYYLTTNRTELELAQWLGSHGAAVALQATLGAAVSLALAYVSYEFFEKRFLELKRFSRRPRSRRSRSDLPRPGSRPARRNCRHDSAQLAFAQNRRPVRSAPPSAAAQRAIRSALAVASCPPRIRR